MRDASSGFCRRRPNVVIFVGDFGRFLVFEVSVVERVASDEASVRRVWSRVTAVVMGECSKENSSIASQRQLARL